MTFDALIRDLESTVTKLDEDGKVCHLLLNILNKMTVLETTSSTPTLYFVQIKLLDVELKLNNCQNYSNLKVKCHLGNVKSSNGNANKCFMCRSFDHYQKKYQEGYHKSEGSNNQQKRYQNHSEGRSRGNCCGKGGIIAVITILMQLSKTRILGFRSQFSLLIQVRLKMFSKVNFINDSGAS